MDSKHTAARKHVASKSTGNTAAARVPHPEHKRRQDSQQLLESLQRRAQDAETRVLHLELRNRATLDALDDVQAAAAAEVAELRNQLEHTQQRCIVLAEEAARSARERDDMNDVVLLLVKKVETCNNDYSEWRPARMQMSRSLSIVPQALSTTADSSECTCPQAYAPSVVSSLSDLLARERAAHAQTLADAEIRVAHYEAAIARRESELACVVASCASCERCAHLSSVFLEDDSEENAVPQVVTERILEVEIRNIRSEVNRHHHHRLQENKLASNSKKSTSQGEQGAAPTLDQLTKEIDDLRSVVHRLASEKDALQRIASSSFPGRIHAVDQSRSATSREVALAQENERLRAALCTQDPESSASGRLRDPFLSPSPNSAEIDSSFPPLQPSTLANSTSFFTTFRSDEWDFDESSNNSNDATPSAASDVPLPDSPPDHESPESHATPPATQAGSTTSSSTAVATTTTAAQRPQAEIAAELSSARHDTERRAQEIEELREAIGALTAGQIDPPS